MSRVKIKLADNIARVVFIETDATVGATIGTDLKMPDGSLATADKLASYIGVTSSTGTMAHRLLSGLAIGNDHPQYVRKDTLTARGDIYVRGATTVERFAIGTDRQILRSDGTDPSWETVSPVLTLGTDLSGNTTFTNLANATLNATIVNQAVTNAKLRDSAALSVIGRSANTSGVPADIASSGATDVLRRSGTAIGFGSIDSTYISNFSSAVPQAANPTALVGLTAANGAASTFMRSDAAPALDIDISPTWTGDHAFDAAVQLNGAGQFTVADGATPVVRVDDNATAGNTRFMLYDVDAGTMVRVSVGANDSGGTGFKVLRVPN